MGRQIGHQRFASPEDYSSKVVNSILVDGQAGGLSYSGVSIENPDAGFTGEAMVGEGRPQGVEPSEMVVYWGAFGHPMHNGDLEVMHHGARPLDWVATRRIILGSAVGWVSFGAISAVAGVARPEEAGKDLSSEQLTKICANAGVPPAVYLLARAGGSGDSPEPNPEPNIGFLWHPNIIQPRMALAGLQAAAALRLDGA